MRRNCLCSRSSFAGLGAALATMPTASMPADCLSYATEWSFPRARNVQRTGNKRHAVQDASRRLGESVFRGRGQVPVWKVVNYQEKTYIQRDCLLAKVQTRGKNGVCRRGEVRHRFEAS